MPFDSSVSLDRKVDDVVVVADTDVVSCRLDDQNEGTRITRMPSHGAKELFDRDEILESESKRSDSATVTRHSASVTFDVRTFDYTPTYLCGAVVRLLVRRRRAPGRYAPTTLPPPALAKQCWPR
jgi:hypothetical protein